MELRLVAVVLLVCIAVVEARFLLKKTAVARSFGGEPTLRSKHRSLSVLDEQRGELDDDDDWDKDYYRFFLADCFCRMDYFYMYYGEMAVTIVARLTIFYNNNWAKLANLPYVLKGFSNIIRVNSISDSITKDLDDCSDIFQQELKLENCVCRDGLYPCDEDYEMPPVEMMDIEYEKADLEQAKHCLLQSKLNPGLINILGFVECVCDSGLHPCGDDAEDDSKDERGGDALQEGRGKSLNSRGRMPITRGLQKKLPGNANRILAQRNFGKQRGFGGTETSESSETIMDLLRELRQLKKSKE